MLVLRLLALLGTALIFGIMFGVAVAHEWYPHGSCHDKDCAVAVPLIRWHDGRQSAASAVLSNFLLTLVVSVAEGVSAPFVAIRIRSTTDCAP